VHRLRASLGRRGGEAVAAHWLLVRGRGDRRLDHEIRADELRAHSSSRKPSVQLGDTALCYAAGWQVIFAVVEVASHPENDPARTRWQWRFAIRPLLALDDLREAPPVEAAAVFPRSLGRHSYIRLTEEQFDLGRAALEAADVTRIVGEGYDAIADVFAEWQRGITGSTRLERVEELIRLLPERPDVLELGIGAGVASSRMLAERGRLVGVELSAKQLRRARQRLPGAELRRADLTEVEFAPASFDAVVAAYVLNHVPRDELGPLLGRVATWLRPGGHLLASFAASDNPGWRGEWLGTEMFFAGFDPPTNRRLVEEAGLTVVRDDVETIVEPEPDPGEARFQWVLARKH
jgi:predicted TPR repeat methyltransferase